MKHYDFAPKFQALYDKAVGLYAKGQRDARTFFNPEEQAWLAANGLTAQHLYDYAEDQNNYGEPGFAQAVAIETIRRNYFVNAQKGLAANTVLDEAKLPAKTDAVKGIEWLPRLLPKAKAKLRGELPASLMYCCGGDRKFFKAHDISPAEFLGLVWRHENNDDGAIVDWVARRSAAAK
ncbi:MAG TPA: DUF5069 domain-containing protein [Opitutaceae bacterium]|nr:DUF5069 domain-containing protein [Opitutaceae bacterium]